VDLLNRQNIQWERLAVWINSAKKGIQLLDNFCFSSGPFTEIPELQL
jgi:hypothetical protein